MRKLVLASAALLIGIGIAWAQQQAPSGSGYGAPYSPQNAPQAGDTTGQAPRFDDRWPTGTPNRPPATMPDTPSTTGQAPESKKINPEESKSGMDE
jgi:hypothetical protein